MSKTPYELRTEILSIAKDYLDKQYEANYHLAERMLESTKYDSKTVEQLMKMYSPEDLMKQAEEFYTKVVCMKDR